MARSGSSQISISRRGEATGDADRTVVWVQGEHDIATKVQLAVAIARAAQLDGADLFVDLRGVTFMDASTVGAIVGSANRLQSRSQSVAVRDPSPSARQILELCGLTQLVHLASTPASHPVGPAAALSTWVAVPVSDPTPSESGDRPSTSESAEREVAEPARSVLGSVDVEVDRRDP